MKEVSKRLKALREGIGITQVKMAEAIGSTQSSINRYENGQSTPSVEIFRRYADFFDVSLDYIFCRTDKPQGKLYEFKPQAQTNPRVNYMSSNRRQLLSVRNCGSLSRCALTLNLL